MENGNRELGQITSDIKYLKDEVDKLRLARHEHSNTLTALVNWNTIMKPWGERIETLEGGKIWAQIGIGAISAIIGSGVTMAVLTLFGQHH